MNPFQRNDVNPNAQHLIRNLPVPTFEQSVSSFASSRNEFSKVHHKHIEDSPQAHEMNLFPSNNDPSLILVDGQSIINMAKKSTFEKRQIMSDLAIENNMLQRKVRELEDRLFQNDKMATQQNSYSQKKMTTELKKLKQQMIQKDKKNTQLFKHNKELDEQIKNLKQEIETKSRQLNSKNIELRKQKQRFQSLPKAKQIPQINDIKTNQLVQELARRQSQLRNLKNQNSTLFSKIQQLKNQLSTAKEHFLYEMQSQTERYRTYSQQLLQRIKTQSISRSNSIRSSTVSNNTSLSQSFSPQMFSPQQTVDLIFHVLRKISKSQMMLKILDENSQFLDLIEYFVNRRR